MDKKKTATQQNNNEDNPSEDQMETFTHFQRRAYEPFLRRSQDVNDITSQDVFFPHLFPSPSPLCGKIISACF